MTTRGLVEGRRKLAVIYCRVSSKAQLKRGDGLSSQETRCREHARFKGYDVIKVFRDDLTGTNANRPGLRALLAYLAEQGREIVVLVDDISRIARKVEVHFQFRQDVAKLGGRVETPSMELNDDDADSELQEYLLATIVQHQSRKNREQTINRMRSRVLNGYYPFQPPLGYRHVRRAGQGALLVPNEPIASIIKEALEGFASGRFQAQVEVKRFLESQPDFPKCLPNGTIRNQRIRELLTRVVYAGYVECKKWNIMPREGQHEGLISYATHQKILERLNGKAKAPARTDINADFPLRGFILCGDCERPMTACWATSKNGKKHPYYMCANRDCVSNRKSVRRDELEGAFEALLRSLQPTKKLFGVTRRMFEKLWDTRLKQADQIKTRYQVQIKEVDDQIQSVVDRIISGGNPTVISAFEQRIAKLEAEKMVLMEKASQAPEPKRGFDELFEHACTFLSNPWKLWESPRLEDKRLVLKLAFSERLAYHRNQGLRTPQLSEPFRFLGNFGQESGMARNSG